MDRTHRALLVVVAVIVAATGIGMALLWPDADRLPDLGAPPEDLVDGRILSVEVFDGEPEPMLGLSGAQVRLEVEVLDGPDRGEVVIIETPVEGYPAFHEGDRVLLARSQIPDGETLYFVTDFRRTTSLVVLLALFVLAVLAVSRWKGLRALVGLGLSLLVVTMFIVPGIITGRSPIAVALVGAVAVMLVTLYFAHGVNEMTTSAVVGTVAALTLTVALGAIFVEASKLTGFASEEANLARFAVEGLDLKGLVLAGLIIAAVGVLDDVTVSQASTVFAIYDANRGQTWVELFTRAMRVGRDHIASVVNTLFLVYAGASLALLVLFSVGGLSTGEIVNTEVLAEEIVKIVVGSLGLISAVPFTTALAATVAINRPADAPPVAAHAHAHGEAAMVAPAQAAPGAAPLPDLTKEYEGLDEDERAYHAWLRFLKEGGAEPGRKPGEGTAGDGPGEDKDASPQD